LSLSWPRALPWCSSLPPAPAAADPELPELACAEVPPLADVEPPALDCAPWPADELALPLADGEVPPAAPLEDGDAELLLEEGDVEPLLEGRDELPDAVPEPEDWLVCAPWFIVEDGLVVVALWLADVLLETFWSPEPTFTPGLMLALALTSVLLMPTFASTPTFGFTFTPPEGEVLLVLADGPLEPLVADGELVLPEALPEPDDWLVCVLWVVLEDGLVVLALWFADTPLDVFWSPVPRFTPGLTFAPALTSLLLMPTLASTPTFGFTFTPPEGLVLLPEPLDCVDCVDCELWSVVDEDWANAEPKTLITAAAVRLTATWGTLMISPFVAKPS